ncbi:MAG: glycoside hydrolase family 9 protein [Fibromonadales bacterium]|nr:glycoside hydrolase family 9 protein [Fibromonadales bacterium]
MPLLLLFLASLSFAQSIMIDQFGYREQAKKIAVINYSPGSQVQVINEASGNMEYSGAPTAFNSGQTDAASGDKIWHFDFSSVKAPGKYYIFDQTNDVRSYSFRIADDVYNNVLKAAVKTFYYQRAGIAKTAQFAGEEWTDAMCFAQDEHTRDFFKKSDASAERDLRGGWFDAGDYNKYTKWTADYVAEMLLIYEENPGAFTDDFGIPESGNGTPDILDEVKWGIDWLLKMQNSDGSMLSVQGLASGSPPSSVTGQSYYGPANATASFGSAKAFAIAARILNSDELKTAAIKAWEWGTAHPDSMFSNNQSSNNSSGLAAGNQEIIDNEHTTDRVENMVTAAWYLFELTENEEFLAVVEANLKKFPLFSWTNFMDHYRHSSHMLYIRYINDQRGNQALKTDVRNALKTAFAKAEDFNGSNGYASDGYRAFIKNYDWGSNKAKSDYGLTFYKWKKVDSSIDEDEFTARAEGYLHYIHGTNPFNMVFLTNMEQYGASRSQKVFYHSWFDEEKNVTPAPGFLPGGPNAKYNWDGCCPSGCGSAANNAKCNLVPIPSGLPPARMYVETGIGWPINSWEITENSNGYQLSYIRLLSKFAGAGSNSTPMKKRETVQNFKITQTKDMLQIFGGKALQVSIYSPSGKLLAKQQSSDGTLSINLQNLPKGVFLVRVFNGSVTESRVIAR